MSKVGRNEPCPCGSGRKYKKCHGDPLGENSPNNSDGFAKIEELNRRSQAKEIQRIQQQGHGKRIISAFHKGHRFVAVGNELHISKNHKTFHDFLFDFLKKKLGFDWGTNELKKESNPHPVIVWYRHLCEMQKRRQNKQGEIYESPSDSFIEGYLRLAYNLYLIRHNAELSDFLLSRLRKNEYFRSHFFETMVCALFINAGFEISIENELDSNGQHPEFKATSKQTGKRFAVEAKSCQPSEKIRFRNQAYRALKKNFQDTRVVFIELNLTPPLRLADPKVVDSLIKERDEIERGMTINGQPLPPAYIFLTNHPFNQASLFSESYFELIGLGVGLSDWGHMVPMHSVQQFLDARNRHREMEEIFTAFKAHQEIPSTFDGELPEFAHNPPSNRLIIGNEIEIVLEDGTKVAGKLTTGTVNPQSGMAHCAIQGRDGRSRLVAIPLSNREVLAYRRSPNTFFGVFHDQGESITDPASFYDWIVKSYEKTDRETMLCLVSEKYRGRNLDLMTKEELVDLYARNVVANIFKIRTE